MFLFDNRITLENRDVLEEYLNGFEYKTSGLSYSALYMWRDINQFSWTMMGDYMCLSGISATEFSACDNVMRKAPLSGFPSTIT